MSEAFLVFFVLAILALLLIGFITVVSWFLKLISGGGATPKPINLSPPTHPDTRAHGNFCEGCGARLQPADLFCQLCGRPQPQSLQSAQADLAITERVLRRLRDSQRLDEASFAHLRQVLENERELLSDSARQPAAHSTPVAPQQPAPCGAVHGHCEPFVVRPA